MGLFEKKYCDICGNKIGVLGNRKLEDGNCCKDCAKKLSPWFDERRHSGVAQIREQLDYREANKAAVDAFNATRAFGEGFNVLYVDEGAQKFLVAGGTNFKNDNPDVLDFSQVIGVNLDVRDSRRELKQKDAEGREVSFDPPRFEYEYDFYIVIRVNHPWFSEMRFQLNRNELVIQELGAVRSGIFAHQTTFDPHMSYDYQNYENMAKEITDILQGSTFLNTQAGPSAELIAEALAAAQAVAMAKAPAVDKEKLISEIRSDPAKAEQARAWMGEEAWSAMMSGGAPDEAGAAVAAFGSWVCSCGAQNTGKFCEYCGSPRP